MQNSYVDKDTPILFYDFYEEMTIDTDNIDANIADDIRGDFVLNSDIEDIQSPQGFSSQLDITVYNGDNVIENPVLIYSSSDEDVVTIDEDGNYQIVGDVGKEAEITVMIKNNVLSRLVIPVRVVEEFMDIYTIKLSDTPQKLRQGDKMVINAYVCKNNEIVTGANVTCTPNYINDKYYTLHQVYDNTWEVVNVKPYSKDLVLTFTNSEYSVSTEKSIKLTAMW